MSIELPKEPFPGAFKPYWRYIWGKLRQYQVNALYHVTDERNLPSIRRHGALYSWAVCERKGIAVPFPGGTDLSRTLDRSRGLEEYVRLCFNPEQPAFYTWKSAGRVAKLVTLKVDPVVALLKSTRFSDENATASAAVVGPDREHFEALRLDIATSPRWSGPIEKRFFQAEVLVFQEVPARYLLNRTK